jgi:hypothetical protein
LIKHNHSIFQFTWANSNKAFLVIVSILVIILMIDASFARVYDLIPKQSFADWKIILFAALALISLTCQYFILIYIEKKNLHAQGKSRHGFRRTSIVLRMSQLTISTLLVIVIVQTAFSTFYYLPLVISLVSISYGLAIVMMAILAYQFSLWSRINKNHVTILYAVASASLSVNAGITLVYASDILVDGPFEKSQFSVGSMVTILPNSSTAMLNSGFFVSSIISFSLLWIATVVLLRNHALRLGKLRYWLVISSPLVLFASQFVSFFIGLLNPMFGSDPVSAAFWTTIIFTLSKPIGGVLFGAAFFTIARSVGQNSVLKTYLLVSGCGFILLYAANQASVLLVTPFPPFGITSVSFVGFASYLAILGIYSSAILISEDSRLRQLVRKVGTDQSSLLDNMGTALLKQEIEKRVQKALKENSDKMIEVTGVSSLSSEQELRQYIDEVMSEIKAERESGNSAKGSKEEK